MASQTPIFVLDENLPFHRGKNAGGVKADVPKSAKPARRERKALQDLSKTGKPLPTGALKGSTLKDKAAVHGHETPKNGSKDSFLTDEEIKKCHEWAKEGIEHAHFTGTEQRKLQREKNEERVKKKVDKVMSALREWTDMAYNFGLPVVDAADVAEDTLKLEFEPEVLPPRARSHLNSEFSTLMQGEFEMSMIGELNFFLGLQIKQEKEGIFINQTKYTKEILKKFSMESTKPLETLMSPSFKLDKDENGNDKLEDLLEAKLDWYPFLDEPFELKLKDDTNSKVTCM